MSDLPSDEEKVSDHLIDRLKDRLMDRSIERPLERRYRQLRLLPYRNVLAERLGTEFFSKIPKLPGVYRFKDRDDELLYVGKAKDLRSRLQTYRRATPENSPRKVLRMLQQAHQIEWELCESEEAALLRENDLLRTLKPPFNRINTRPEYYSYLYFAHDSAEEVIRLIIAREPAIDRQTLVFGAFKSKFSLVRGLAALNRLLIAIEPLEAARYSRLLSRPLTLQPEPEHLAFALPIPESFLPVEFRAYIQGRHDRLLDRFPVPEEGAGFEATLRASDLEEARQLFTQTFQRNYLLRRRYRPPNRVLTGPELDDLIARRMAGKNSPSEPDSGK